MIETRNKDWRNNQSGFGYRLLTKMGWSEGNGLGKNKQGSTDIITVEKRATALGLGTSSDQLGHHAWSETSSSYENLLNQLRGKYSMVNNNKTSDAPKDETDESETEGKGQNSKKKMEQLGNGNDEVINKKSKQAVENKMTTKYLSYHKVLKSKNVSLYSQEDLAAILGSSIHKNLQPTQVQSIQTNESSITISETIKPTNESNDNKKKKEKRKREVVSDEKNNDHEFDKEQETKKRKKKEKKSKK